MASRGLVLVFLMMISGATNTLVRKAMMNLCTVGKDGLTEDACAKVGSMDHTFGETLDDAPTKKEDAFGGGELPREARATRGRTRRSPASWRARVAVGRDRHSALPFYTLIDCR